MITLQEARGASKAKWVLEDKLFVLQNQVIEPNWTSADVFARDRHITAIKAEIARLNNIIDAYLEQEMSKADKGERDENSI